MAQGRVEHPLLRKLLSRMVTVPLLTVVPEFVVSATEPVKVITLPVPLVNAGFGVFVLKVVAVASPTPVVVKLRDQLVMAVPVRPAALMMAYKFQVPLTLAPLRPL
jgi:hypothetical protein